VPILPPLRQVLDAVPLPPPSDLVCASAEYAPVTKTGLRKNWEGYLHTLSNIANGDTATPFSPGRRSDKDDPDKPRIEVKFRTHDLRHTYCTILYDAGVDIKSAQDFLGHKTRYMTEQIYTHLTDERRQQSVDAATKHTEKFLK